MQEVQFLQCCSKHYHELLAIWERSVQQTHHFLTPADIAQLKGPVLKEYFPLMENIIGLVGADRRIRGFIGTVGTRIEMLFVDPEYFRQGAGKQLIEYAIAHYGVDSVDVNEQNEDALAFYVCMGFKVVGRSALDGQGNPFPLLHMQL